VFYPVDKDATRCDAPDRQYFVLREGKAA